MFSGRRIKAPQRGLLAMHPFVDVLEGRSLMTATAHEGVLAVEAFIDAATSAPATSPWSQQLIGRAESTAVVEESGTALARRTTPPVFHLNPGTADAPFSEQTIGDTPWALFGNALHDRRGPYDPHPLPTEDQLAAARETQQEAADAFNTGRSFTGAMMPFLTMTMKQSNHPFA